jgi:hypothetical protein
MSAERLPPLPTMAGPPECGVDGLGEEPITALKALTPGAVDRGETRWSHLPAAGNPDSAPMTAA